MLRNYIVVRSFLTVLSSILLLGPLTLEVSAANRITPAIFSAAAMGLELGPHQIGFKVVHTYDYSRSFRPQTEFSIAPLDQESMRPMQILLWYPAVSDPSNPDRAVTYREIVETEHTQIEFRRLLPNELAMARKSHDTLMRRNIRTLDGQALDALWGSETGSKWSARPASGKFPLVVWSGNSATYAFLVCEYLASHGYVGASAPGIGRWSEEYVSSVPNPVHLATQSDDLEFVIGYLGVTFPWIDTSRLALTGFSTTNLATILHQMKNLTADAVVL